MRYSKFFYGAFLVGALTLTGVAANAQDGYWNNRDIHRDRQDLHRDYRDLNRDYGRADHLRNNMAEDRYRVNQDLRHGNGWGASREARDLAHDQHQYSRQMRDIHRDHADIHRDGRDLRHDRHGH
jgi:hypothetical protein